MAAARAAPLARRKALLAAMQQISAPLGRILALCAAGDKTRLVIESVAVPLAEYGRLSVEDFMVSLYNDHSVQRLLLVTVDGARHDMLDTLEGAIAALDGIEGAPPAHRKGPAGP
ncbi:MAG: hypothetical protein MO852_11710 [Candidatus Devosia euplotis]|nr:hypothetical protein [Candidatus Devosia euplotis]